MNVTGASPTFLAVADLVGRWGVSDDTVRRILHSGDLPFSRIGGQIRVRVEDVTEYESRGQTKRQKRRATYRPSVPDRASALVNAPWAK